MLHDSLLTQGNMFGIHTCSNQSSTNVGFVGIETWKLAANSVNPAGLIGYVCLIAKARIESVPTALSNREIKDES